MIKGVIFDLFGTLAYIADKRNPYARLFCELGLTIDDLQRLKKIALTKRFFDLASFVARIKPDAQIDTTEYEKDIAKEIASIALYPETEEVLHELRQKKLRIGMISNLASPYTSTFFSLGLDKLVDHYVFSCDIGMIKPNPKIYVYELQALCVQPSETIMVGDKIPQDVLGPKVVGITGLLLDRENKMQHTPKIASLREIIDHL